MAAPAPAPAQAPARVFTPEELELPQYFPLKLKKCAAPAEAFFACFETEAAPNGDKDVARKAVAKCGELLLAYKSCMDNFVGPKAAGRGKPASSWWSWLGYR
ncbi:hypothetical protein HK105_201199 [Polyrhizophydium stewartii]|uniref:Uncharacterized protein n=1 Tax=Polyrhizophydium stewartii TaxID=2732419 RepID=A0ABR4NJ50_9FUNG|nr:hypothetical protein HK105_005841 [Polyrhizophydium stewartii]